MDALDDAAIAEIAANPAVVRRIIAAAGLMTMAGVGERMNISYYRVKILRVNRTKLGTEGSSLPRSDALPESLPVPGDPLWHPAEIETWGRQTGRLSADGSPRRAQPTGRPRRKPKGRVA